MRLGAELGEQAHFAPPAPTVGRSTAAGTAMVTSATARGLETMITCEPGLWRTPARSTNTWHLCRRGEEVDKQFVDAFGLVVMHPVRRVGQALHAVEVGHIVALGLGEVGAEVGIALPPDHQCRRRDRAKLCDGFLLGLPYRGAVVVDHPGRCSRLRPRLDVAPDFVVGVR